MRSMLLVSDLCAGATSAALAAKPAAIVFDLGDTAGGDREAARRAVSARLREIPRAGDRPLLLVRIASLRTGPVDADLDAIMDAAPDAVVAPGIVGAHDVEHLGAKLAVAEAVRGCRPGVTGIVAVAADSASGVLALPSLARGAARLRALAFDDQAFGLAPDAAPLVAGRSALVLAAMAVAVPAIHFGRPAPDDLARDCAATRNDGFAGHLARSPAEVATVEACFGSAGSGHRRPP